MEDLKQDLIEAAESRYHRRVTEIQVAAQEAIENYLHTIQCEQDRYEDTHPSDTVEEIQNAFAERVKNCLQNIRERRGRVIATEKEILERTKDAIVWYCIAKEIAEYSVSE